EILLTSMDQDGTYAGYDLHITRKLSEELDVPIIPSGGVGNPQHIYEGFSKGKADAALAASIFHFSEYSIREVKEYLREREIPVRL
ncbi:MAG: HisA/HisF-related TIM barrel protein, partial [Methanosarcina sp.]|nr:HisA/HisF-related TIM barrel protein [Methanosarcina sp.]